MSNCSCCGSSVPEGQSVCSMCYGDIGFGSDGYYRDWAEKQLQKDYEKEDLEVEHILRGSDDLPF